jgi:hypothetical protein
VNEGEVYVAVSRYLRESGWIIIGGQPPAGTDHLPVIEIKDPAHLGKGSKGSFKPDLVAWDGAVLLLVELKPKFSMSDRTKLFRTLEDPRRIRALWREIGQREIRDPEGIRISEFGERATTWGALGFAGESGQLGGLWGIRIRVDGSVVMEGRTQPIA